MPRKSFTAEKIAPTPRAAEVEFAQGQPVVAVCRKLGVTANTCYRRRREYGGLQVDQAERPKDLEHENGRLENPPPMTHGWPWSS